MKNVEKAREAFKEKYGATPEEKGFFLVEKIGKKIVFSRSKKALEAFRQGEKIKRDSIKSLFLTSFIAVALWGIYLFLGQPDEANVKTGFILIFSGWALLTLQSHSKKEVEYTLIKESWKGKIVFYDLYEKKIINF